MTTIAILGNNACPFSTESELAWTIEHLGHRVVKLQENAITTDEVVCAVRERGSRLLIWVHTHGWEMIGNISQDKMLNELRSSGIKTASFHLDRFWGLNALDQREERIGKHAFWHTDVVFTADGGNDDRFRERGVNHVWLKAGVVERDCYLGVPEARWGNQVVFLGADGYHPEHAFRGLLCSRLKEQYGSNFRIYQGVRQGDLNNLLATARVVVGDHCFSGKAPRYCSDRLYETTGRGGFLIYPETEGITEEIPGLVTYEPQNIGDLVKKVNYYLVDEHQAERIQRRNQAHEWVKANGTYTNRMKEMLAYLGVK